ncbi:MAG TPA: hypothetical protein VMI53_12285 [Opitutaceae bacterium]|nr:hypothetical protein [Opitutaceae bacterium]
MDKKVMRAMYGPSLTEVVLGAILSFAVGVVLAALYLIFKPVEVVKQLPPADKQVEGMVYYVQGTENPAKGQQLLRKQQLFIEGSSVNFTEDELNTWMAATSGPPKKPAPDATASLTTELNFRIRNGVLQIGFPCTLNLLGISESVIIQMKGGFRKEGDAFVYEPKELYIGSLPAQRLPVLPGLLMKKIYSAQQLPEELVTAWKKLADVTIEDSTLKLTMPK